MATRWSAFSASVITKVVIAATGLALYLYLVVHLIGNTLVFLGPSTFNGYAEMLVSNPLIVPVELGLALIFLIHIYKAVTMWWANEQARPVAYEKKERAGAPSRKGLASSSMIWSGLLTALFVVVHVKTFKFGTFYQVENGPERDLYRLVAETFDNPLWVGFYVVFMVVIGLHIWHGFASAFESLGGNHPRYTPRVLAAGKVLAFVIAGGFILIPLIFFFFLGGRS